MHDGHAGREPLGANGLGRALDDAARGIDLPPVVDASDGVALDASEGQRGAAVRAQLVKEADPAVLGPEGDVVLAEQAHRRRAVSVHEVRRHRERNPVVLAHEPTHRRVAVDARQQFVLPLRDHGRGSLIRSNDVPRVSGGYCWPHSSTGKDTITNE